jgi:hypothetical protein
VVFWAQDFSVRARGHGPSLLAWTCSFLAQAALFGACISSPGVSFPVRAGTRSSRLSFPRQLVPTLLLPPFSSSFVSCSCAARFWPPVSVSLFASCCRPSLEPAAGLALLDLIQPGLDFVLAGPCVEMCCCPRFFPVLIRSCY